jgi:hypothetical protein
VSACVHRFPACVHRGKDARRGSELSRTFTHCQTSWGGAPPDGPHSRAGSHAAEPVGERPHSRDCPPGAADAVFVTHVPALLRDAPSHSTGLNAFQAWNPSACDRRRTIWKAVAPRGDTLPRADGPPANAHGNTRPRERQLTGARSVGTGARRQWQCACEDGSVSVPDA